MKLGRLLAVFCFAFCSAGLALPVRAETAGQVLVALGDVLGLREGRIVRLDTGSAVESGDQIHTGADGYVQIRFTDWSVISIRQRSDFVVDEYAYEPRVGGRERAFFSLLKGGVRSLTGLIGHRDRKNYRMRAPTATIGIRGTQYSVLFCQRECKNSDGSIAVDGLYGEVSEGRIAVIPSGGTGLEREFGAGEYFHLANEKSAPVPLFLPPRFLRDTLGEQARAENTDAGTAPAVPLITSTVSTVPAPVVPPGTQLGSVIGSPVNLRLTPPAVTPTLPVGLPPLLPIKK